MEMTWKRFYIVTNCFFGIVTCQEQWRVALVSHNNKISELKKLKVDPITAMHTPSFGIGARFNGDMTLEDWASQVGLSLDI
jgi:hypothetical protein